MANPRAIQLSAMDQLILQRRYDNERKNEENERNQQIAQTILNEKSNDKPTKEVKQESLKDIQKKEEEHPELAIPDIPENKRVRDYLKSQPLTGHGDAFGKSIRIVQCYRCKCYGHRPGDPECKYTESGDLNLELQKRVKTIREDPMYYFKRINSSSSNEKINRMKELLNEAKEEEKHRHKHKHKHRHHSTSKIKHINHYSSSSNSS